MTQYDPLFDISNKTVIVTGASSGLGVTFAKFLAERGANVAITARRVEKLNDLNQELIENGLSSIKVKYDVSQSSQVKELFDKT